MTPRVIDAYCCAGGAGVGYQRAGLAPYGIDRDPQPRYPGPFLQADAPEALAALLDGQALTWTHPDGGTETLGLEAFSAAHGSPPCQIHTALTKGNRGRAGWTDDHVDLIPETRDLFTRMGLPYVLENVQGSGLRRDLTLCGEQFGLRVIRHRYFELGGWTTDPVPHVPHRGRVTGWRHGVRHDGPYFAVYGEGGGKGSVAEWQDAMGIHWTAERRELAEAIPPAYTELVGSRLVAHGFHVQRREGEGA